MTTQSMRGVGIFLLALVVSSTAAFAQERQNPDVETLTSLSLQELMNVEVFSVSKTARKLSDSAAAVYVISAEQIRRSGATSLPEVLRTVPGLHVARIDSNKWAISARGFNGRFATKLLVLIDGRSVYTPLFSGVDWNLQDVLLEDVDRIEVVRGPGATLWGANAVNGIINIITKPANETRGILATLSHGAVEGTVAGLRYGGSLGTDGAWRAYAKAFDRDSFVALDGRDANDDWRMLRGGFRIDLRAGDASIQLQGDVYSAETGSIHQTASFQPPYATTMAVETKNSGGNLLGAYRRKLGEGSFLELRGYYDRIDRSDMLFTEVRDTYDLEAQHQLQLGSSHELVWGAGYRLLRDDIGNSLTVTLDPARRNTGLFNAFVQDDISLVPDRVRLTVGTKLEHNDYTGWEVQPNGRILWHIDGRQTLWGAVSRAVRTPSRVEEDGRVITTVFPPFSPANPSPFPLVPVFVADGTLESEGLVAYELGYRLRPADTLSLDVAAFINEYDGLRDSETGTPFFGSGVLFIPVGLVSALEARVRGFELAVEWQPEVWARVHGGYSFLDLEERDPREPATASTRNGGPDPQHQFFVWGAFEPAARLEFDVRFRYSSALHIQEVPSFLTADLRAGWRFENGLELALVGQNLLHARRTEFVSELTFLGLPAQLERSLHAVATWQF